MKKSSRRSFLRKSGAGLLGLLSGCLSQQEISHFQEVFKRKNLIVGYEGAILNECRELIDNVSLRLGFEKYMGFVARDVAKIAKDCGRKIGVVGYSLGRWGAEEFVYNCDKIGVDVDLAVIIDGVDPGRKVTGNLKRMVQMWGDNSTNFYGARGRFYRKEDFENPEKTECPAPVIISNCGHLEMPKMARSYVLAEFASIVR